MDSIFDFKSKAFLTSYNVPQGSHLPTLLFSLFTINVGRIR